MSAHHPFVLPSHHSSAARRVLYALLMLLALGGCGGGGGGGGSQPATPGGTAVTPPSPAPVVNNAFVADCSGAGCGALDDTTYAGSGVGIWRYSNTTTTSMPVQIGISGTLGRSVTLIQTNLADSDTTFGGGGSPSLFGSARSAAAESNPPDTQPENRIPDQIRHFTPPALEPIDPNAPVRSLRAPEQPTANVLHSSRNWYDHEDTEHTATLQLQRSLGGRLINFWVENGEYGGGRVSEEQLTALADAFTSGGNAIYSMVTGLAGAPWGSHAYGNLIPPSSTQPIDIVLLNLTPDNQPYGLIGFFWGRNNFLRSSEPFSNESLSLYLDTETLYLGGPGGLLFEISTLAHELVHMINFYQRSIVRSTLTIDYSFDTWLEEMSALMMEDIVGLRMNPFYHVIRDDRFPTWVAAGDFNCDVTVFDDDVDSPCFGYNLSGSLGAWLLRHYGIDFYRALLTNTSSTDSIAVLDNAIRAAGGAGFKDAVRRWGTLLALLPSNSPAPFGLPERSELGFTLPAIDGTAYILTRQLPTTAPTTLVPNGHFPQLRSNVADPFVETVMVPPQTTLTVIVQ